MRHLFSVEGERALQTVMRLEPLLAFDFDGTLAPIVARPEGARVSTAVSHSLGLIAQLRPVAIITGRTVADVAPRLGFEPRYIIGNHGAEDPSGHLPTGSTSDLEAVRRRIAHQATTLHDAGVEVEDKRYSLALHFRLARDRALAKRRIESLLLELEPGLKVFGGKFVVNVVPADAPDKGDAVVSLLRQSGASSVVFVGDDVNDEAVFALAEEHWLTVRIGRDDAGSRARFFLDSHSEVATLLRKILSLLRPGRPRPIAKGQG